MLETESLAILAILPHWSSWIKRSRKTRTYCAELLSRMSYKMTSLSMPEITGLKEDQIDGTDALTQCVPQSCWFCKAWIMTQFSSSSCGPTTSTASWTTQADGLVLCTWFSTPPWKPRPGSPTSWIPFSIMQSHLMSAAIGPRDTGSRGEIELWA